MKHYNKPELAHAAARRHVARHGGTAAVVETLDLPGTYQVGTLHEVLLEASRAKLRTCKLFLGITGRRYQRVQSSGSNPIIELDTALLCKGGNA